MKTGIYRFNHPPGGGGASPLSAPPRPPLGPGSVLEPPRESVGGARLNLHAQQHSHEVRAVLDGDGSARRVVHKYGGVLAGLGGEETGGRR